MSEKREMTAVEFLKEWNRMCNAANDCVNDCPLNAALECGRYCDVDAKRNPEEVVAIVQKWAEEHPVKTRMSDFYEKYPNAKRCGDGITPQVCAKTLGYLDKCAGRGCAECWSGPLEVKP